MDILEKKTGGMQKGERIAIGTEFELKISADPVNTEPVDRPQARPVFVVPICVRHWDIVQFGYTPGCRTARAGTRQALDLLSRTRILNELMRTAEGKDRFDRDEEIRKGKRARVEMDVSDGHDKPAEAKGEDDQMEEGQAEQSEDKSSGRKNDEASDTAGRGIVQHGGSSSST